MEIGKIISNSFRYPFKNIKKLPILFALFVLMAIIPIGMLLDNRYVMILGAVAFFLFILIVPGYLLSFVRIGLNESSLFPSLSIAEDIFNTIRLLVLRVVYMLMPAIVFFIALTAVGSSAVGMLSDMNIHGFILAMAFSLIIVLIVYILFEILLFFAKARLAYLNSLTEALKMHKVVGDIMAIGIVNIIAWLIFMGVLLIAVSFVASLVMMIPYVGFLIYICIVIPTLESIGNYSLGLLYSNIAEREDDLDKFNRELQVFKYFN